MEEIDRAVIRWTIWTILGFKIVTSLMVLWVFPSWGAVGLVSALSVPWFVAGALWLRRWIERAMLRRRIRARRAQLIASEWDAG